MTRRARGALAAVVVLVLARGMAAEPLEWRPFKWVDAVINGHRLERAALIVPVSLAGLPGEHHLQLDLGATRSVLHGSALSDLRPSASPVGTSTAISGTVAGVTVHDHAIDVLPGFRATLTPGQPLPVIGTLGLDFFQHRILVIDFPGRRVTILPAGADVSSVLAAPVTFLPAEQRNGKLYVPVVFDGATQSGFFFDTGASAFVMVTSGEEWTRLTGRRRDDPANLRLTGSSWEAEVALVGAPMTGTLGVGPASLARPTIWFADDERFSFSSWPATRGLIGNEVFADRAIVVIDLPRHQFGVLVKP